MRRARALRLNATSGRRGRSPAGFRAADVPEARKPVLNLSPSGDLKEAAANLFAMLRALDASGATRIAVMPIPTTAWAKRSTTGCDARRRTAGRAMNAETLARLKDAVGPEGLHRGPRRDRAASGGMAQQVQGPSPLLLKPATTADRSPRSSPSATRPARPSCRRAAIPDWSAGRFRSTAKCCSASRA